MKTLITIILTILASFNSFADDKITLVLAGFQKSYGDTPYEKIFESNKGIYGIEYNMYSLTKSVNEYGLDRTTLLVNLEPITFEFEKVSGSIGAELGLTYGHNWDTDRFYVSKNISAHMAGALSLRYAITEKLSIETRTTITMPYERVIIGTQVGLSYKF